jgi:hypothetical protein
MPENDLAVYPVVKMNVRIVASEGLVLIQPYYSAFQGANLEDAIPSRWYALTRKQALDIAASLEKTAKSLGEN